MDTLVSMNNMAGLIESSQGTECLRVMREMLGDKHPRTIVVAGSISDLYQAQGRFGEAEPLNAECVHENREKLGEARSSWLRSVSSYVCFGADHCQTQDVAMILEMLRRWRWR